MHRVVFLPDHVIVGPFQIELHQSGITGLVVHSQDAFFPGFYPAILAGHGLGRNFV
jgi:hypothetical protein